MKNSKIIFPIYLIIIFLISDFLIGSIYTRFSQPHYPDKEYRQSNSYYHHGLKANIKSYGLWGTQKHSFTTNSLGFKDSISRNISLNTKKDRILFIGDSFTEGVGYSFENTFVGILATNIDTSKIEILNTACVSYSPKLYYLKIKYLIENLHLIFNELYVFIDLSDIQDEIVYEDFIPGGKTKLVSFKVVLYNYIKQHSAIGFILNRFSIIHPPGIKDWTQENYWKERGKWTNDETIIATWGNHGMELASSNMQLLIDLCKSKNIIVKIAIYPWPLQIQNRNLNDLNVELWTSFCKKNEIELINFYPDFINEDPPEKVIDKYFIKDDSHLNNYGHILVANKIYSYIR